MDGRYGGETKGHHVCVTSYYIWSYNRCMELGLTAVKDPRQIRGSYRLRDYQVGCEPAGMVDDPVNKEKADQDDSNSKEDDEDSILIVDEGVKP
ncbi:hypothetical protein R6Q59_012512 [Mikania micrantha]